AWAVGSMLACIAAILIINRSAGQLGFIVLILLILPGFTAAMFGGFQSMVGTFFGGLVLGVVEAVFIAIRWPAGTLRDMFGAAVFFGLIALSLVVLIGWTGQLNLCPLAFAGVGAWTAAILSTSAHLPFWVVMPCCGLVAVPFALLIGIPALRLRGFFLALATMAFAFAAEQWLFTQSFLSNRNQVSPILGRGDLNQPAYYLLLFTAAMVFVALRNLQGTKVARAFRAIRDSETTAVAMGIDPVRYKL